MKNSWQDQVLSHTHSESNRACVTESMELKDMRRSRATNTLHARRDAAQKPTTPKHRLKSWFQTPTQSVRCELCCGYLNISAGQD